MGMIFAPGAMPTTPMLLLPIAAALEIPDPRDRPPDKRQAADEAHAKFAEVDSDFLAYLKIWDLYHELKQKLSRNRSNNGSRSVSLRLRTSR